MLELLFAPAKDDLIDRTRWYINIRWFVLLVIAVPGLLTQIIGAGWSADARRGVLLAGIALLSNAVFFGLARLPAGKNYYRIMAVTLLAVDILLVTFLIYNKGGTESRSPILYVIPILASSAIFGRRAVYVVALASVLCYDALIIADYLGIIRSLGTLTGLRSDLPYAISTVVFVSSVLFIISSLADFINKQLVMKERQASASAAALARAQSVAKLGSWEWDITNDKLTWSDEQYKIFGLERGGVPVTYQTYSQRIHPDDQEYSAGKVSQALEDLKPFNFDHRVIWPDGSVHYVHGEGEVMSDQSGRPVVMHGTSRDITSEWALDRAKNEFVSLASHQLRTPASGVKAFLSLLADGYAGPLNEDQQRFLDRAYQANERQLQIVSDLLNVANVESGRIQLRRKPLDLCALVGAIADEHQPAIEEKRQTLTVHKPERPIIVNADPRYFHMVIDNLLSNASKYTGEGGFVAVRLSRRQGNAVIKVTDSGVGIKHSDMERLFQKFSRIDNPLSSQVEGSGLGLYLAKHLTELHGGRLSVTSRPGKGSTFTVELRLLPGARRAGRRSTRAKPKVAAI